MLRCIQKWSQQVRDQDQPSTGSPVRPELKAAPEARAGSPHSAFHVAPFTSVMSKVTQLCRGTASSAQHRQLNFDKVPDTRRENVSLIKRIAANFTLMSSLNSQTQFFVLHSSISHNPKSQASSGNSKWQNAWLVLLPSIFFTLFSLCNSEGSIFFSELPFKLWSAFWWKEYYAPVNVFDHVSMELLFTSNKFFTINLYPANIYRAHPKASEWLKKQMMRKDLKLLVTL